MNFRTLFLLVSLIFAALATNVGAADAPITQIKLQHTECYGPCPVDEITLNADGNAQFAGVSNGTRQGFYRGQVAPEKFAALTRALEDQNFFELRAEIGDALTTDAPDAIVSATRGGVSYRVTFRASGNRELLAKLEAAFSDASAQIEWKKDESVSKTGARGTIMRALTAYETRLFADRETPFTQMPMRYSPVTLIAMDAAQTRYSTHSDGEGRFQIFAPPGRYLLAAGEQVDTFRPLESSPYLPFWLADGQIIELKAGQFAPIEVRLDNYTDETKTKVADKTK